MNAIPRPFPVLSYTCLALSKWRQAGPSSRQRGPTWPGILQWVIYTEVRQRKGGRCPADLAVFTVLNTVGSLHGIRPEASGWADVNLANRKFRSIWRHQHQSMFCVSVVNVANHHNFSGRGGAHMWARGGGGRGRMPIG